MNITLGVQNAKILNHKAKTSIEKIENEKPESQELKAKMSIEQFAMKAELDDYKRKIHRLRIENMELRMKESVLKKTNALLLKDNTKLRQKAQFTEKKGKKDCSLIL